MRARTVPLGLGISLALLCACGQPPSKVWSVEQPLPETERTLEQGKVRGGAGRYGSHAWLGIPFAEPPVGERRWKKPLPPAGWKGTRDALKSGSACVQPGNAISGGAEHGLVGSEDCLTLNVWAPALKPSELSTAKLPVMVWVHGGGNTLGTASIYEAGRLATEQHVMVVAVQYRLGPLGWFRHAALRDGSDALDSSGNFGTLDLIRALEWVRQNASAFGGDTRNVTVFGESAGGENIFSLLLARGAKGLFERAIIESGLLWGTDPEKAEGFGDGDPDALKNSSNQVMAKLLVQEGVVQSPNAARAYLAQTPPRKLAKWMRDLPVATLMGAYTQSVAGMLDVPNVFRDGTVLPSEEPLSRLTHAETWNRVPVLLGTNHDEMRLFLSMDPTHVHKVLGLVPRIKDTHAFVATADALTQFWKLGNVDRPAQAMVDSGEPSVYAYRWDWHDEPKLWGTDFSVLFGAAHGFETFFVFGHFEGWKMIGALFTKENQAGREEVSSAMRQYWAQFARSGNPGRGTSGTLPVWHAWDPAHQQTHMVFDTSKNGGVRMIARVEDPKVIVATVMNDSKLSTAAKCRTLQQMVKWGRNLKGPEYRANPACAAFPLESFE